jgi:nitroimidazol reductase NimA-like FMN-containing flavoprotein (pyridoxamine 5'-phosphate oxidase superfamily)
VSLKQTYPQTRATKPSRLSEAVSYDAATVHEILDGAVVCHVGFVAGERPQVLPMLFVRIGSTVFLHSSTGAHLARIAARQAGVEVTLEVTIVDALVLARSAFHYSVNYRAAVAHGRATLLAKAEDKQEILDALMEKVFPGRLGAVRAPTATELRQTAVLALPLLEVSAKVLTGPPEDEPEDLSLECWAGLWPVREVRGDAVAAPDLAPGIVLPSYLQNRGDAS